MKVSLIVSTYNRADALEAVLVSICNLAINPSQVIIADDGSGAETEIIIAKYQKISSIPILHVWHPDEGFRVAEIRNKALALVKSGYVIMIDGDMILNRYFVKDHLNFAQKSFFIQGKRFLLTEKKTIELLTDPSTPFIPQWGDPDNEHRLEKRLFAFRSPLLCRLTSRRFKRKVHGLRACNMSFFYEDLVRINGFNNLFTGWGVEDLELVERLFNAGIKRKDIAFSALAYHLHHKIESRESLPANKLILTETITNKSMWCENELNKFLDSPVEIPVYVEN